MWGWGLGVGELSSWEEAVFQQRPSRTAGLFRGQLITSALPPKAQGLQMPCPCPIFTGNPKPINISTRISYSRHSATGLERHSFVFLGCCNTSVANKAQKAEDEYHSLTPAPQTLFPQFTLWCVQSLGFMVPGESSSAARSRCLWQEFQ